MPDYESKYEEYKKTLLHSSSFVTNLKDKYRNTLYAEKNYIDSDGVLSKIAALSATGGFSYALCLSLTQLNEFPGIMVRVAFAIVGTVCFFRAMRVGSEYKISSAKRIFHSFQYDRHIEEKVHRDKEIEAHDLVREMLDRRIGREDFQERYDALSRYDRFAKNLQEDYDFNEAIQKKL